MVVALHVRRRISVAMAGGPFRWGRPSLDALMLQVERDDAVQDFVAGDWSHSLANARIGGSHVIAKTWCLVLASRMQNRLSLEFGTALLVIR
jgi:hypothetical protein